MNYFVHTIHLSVPLRGNDIATIIELACERNHTQPIRNTFRRNGNESYELGQRSGHKSQWFLVAPTEEGGLFEYGTSYRALVVTEHPDARLAYASAHDNAPLIYAGETFVRAIEKALKN